MHITEAYDCAAAAFGKRLAAVTPGQWTLPTPCPEWDVRALVDHVIGNHAGIGRMLHGRDIDGDDWPSASAAVRSGWALPGVMERQVPSPFGGQASIGQVAWILTADLATHTWDLSRAIGADDTLEPDLVAALYPVLVAAHPAMAGSGKFAAAIPVPDTADPQTRLLALLGRTSNPAEK